MNNAISSLATQFKTWFNNKTQEHEERRKAALASIPQLKQQFTSWVNNPQRQQEERERTLERLQTYRKLQNSVTKINVEPIKQQFGQWAQGIKDWTKTVDTTGIQEQFSNWINNVANQKSMALGPLGYLAGLKNADVANFAADVTYRPLTRVGFEGAQTLSGDTNVYQPKSALEQVLLGKGELRNWNDSNRFARKVTKEIGLPGLGTPLVAAGVLLDATVPGVDDVVRQGGKKVSGELVERLGKEGALKWLLQYGDLLKRAGVKEQMSAVEALNYAEKNPGLLGRVGVMTKNIEDIFKRWVNSRRATELIAVKARLPFAKLDEQGIEGFIKFQAGENSGLFGSLRQYFDEAYKRAIKGSLKLNYRSDYLNQVWENPEQAEQVFKSLGRRPGFTFEKVIDDYAKGIELGLKPRFQKLSDLVGFYEFKLNRSVADNEFFTLLDQTGWIKPRKSGRIPAGWKQITAEGFPVFEEGKIAANYIAPTGLADAINNYLIDPDGAVKTFASFVTGAKNVGLAAGLAIPYPAFKEGKLGVSWIKTALNAHGVNLWARSWIAAKNPLSQILKSTDWMIRPGEAEKFVSQHLDEATKFVKAGMTLSTEDVPFTQVAKEIEGNLIQKGYKIAGNWFDDIFSKPLFSKYVPALKVNYAQEVYNNLVKDLGEVEARRIAAQTANNVFGGINLDELMRNKNTQNVFRSLALAPDWLETQFKIGKGIVDSLRDVKNPAGQAYRVIARNVATYYVMANVMNKAMSGHWMFENEGTSNKFFIDTGTFNERGERRYFRPVGTAIDFVRLPVEVAMGMALGDLGSAGRAVANRLSLPVGSIMHLLSNKNYLNQQIYGNKYGEPMPIGQQVAGIASEVAQGVGVPSQVTSLADLVTGKSGLEETAMRLTELPVRYGDKAFTKKEIQNRDAMMGAGLRGQELNELMTREDKKNTGGFLSWLFGSKVSESDGRKNSALLSALDEEKETDEKSKRIREVFALGLDESGTRKVLEKEGLGTYEEASYVVMKSLGVESGARGKVIQEMLKGLEGDDFLTASMALAENEVLTTGVIAKWVDDGDITEDQADALRDLIKVTKGTYKPAKKKLSIPKIPAPKFSAPEVIELKGPSNSLFKPVKTPDVPEIKLPRVTLQSPALQPVQRGRIAYRQGAQSIYQLGGIR